MTAPRRRAPVAWFPLMQIRRNRIRLASQCKMTRIMRRFKRKCEKSGILSELKKRQHYEKPSAKRKRKMIQARKKMLRKLSEERRASV